MLDGLRGAIRPLVTGGLIIVQCAIGVGWATGLFPADVAEKAFAALGLFTMNAVTFYFKERSDQKS